MNSLLYFVATKWIVFSDTVPFSPPPCGEGSGVGVPRARNQI
jgi:hypothetical protein